MTFDLRLNSLLGQRSPTVITGDQWGDFNPWRDTLVTNMYYIMTIKMTQIETVYRMVI